MPHLVYSVRYSVLPMNSSLLSITVCPSDITTLVYNDKKYPVYFMTLYPSSIVLAEKMSTCKAISYFLFFLLLLVFCISLMASEESRNKFQCYIGKYYWLYFWMTAHFPCFSCTFQGDATHHDISMLSLFITRPPFPPTHTHKHTRTYTHTRNKLTLYVEYCAFLGYYAVSSGNSLPKFRDNLSVPSSKKWLSLLHYGLHKLGGDSNKIVIFNKLFMW
jgi:hypothetical protein